MAWNPTEHSNDENLRWAWLRAVEWGQLPLFVSTPVAPLLFLLYPPMAVVAGVFELSVVWMTARYRIVSVQLASAITVAASAGWITVPFATVLLLLRHRWGVAVFALFWPMIAGALGALTRPQVGRIQMAFMRALGYHPTSINPLDT